MASDIKAPGRSALWTEAALRALGGIATADMDRIRWWSGGVEKEEAVARDGAAMAIRFADAFEQACEERHAAAEEARRERVRAIKCFRSVADTRRILTVQSVEGDRVTFVSFPGDSAKRHTSIDHVLDPECYEPVNVEEDGQ